MLLDDANNFLFTAPDNRQTGSSSAANGIKRIILCLYGMDIRARNTGREKETEKETEKESERERERSREREREII